MIVKQDSKVHLDQKLEHAAEEHKGSVHFSGRSSSSGSSSDNSRKSSESKKGSLEDHAAVAQPLVFADKKRKSLSQSVVLDRIIRKFRTSPESEHRVCQNDRQENDEEIRSEGFWAGVQKPQSNSESVKESLNKKSASESQNSSQSCLLPKGKKPVMYADV